MFSIISAIAKNNAIGKDNDLVFHIKEDMKFFRETTRNHTVIMGKKTWESLPGKLKDRKNLVISHAEVEDADGTITDLDKYIEKNKETDEEIFVSAAAQFINTCCRTQSIYISPKLTQSQKQTYISQNSIAIATEKRL